MSRNLSRVEQALRSNLGIMVVGVLPKNHLPGRNESWGYTTDFYVTFKNDVAYAAEDLQGLMNAFPPGLKPIWPANFQKWNRKEGWVILSFEESVGTETGSRQIVLTDENLFSSNGFIEGKYSVEYSEPVWQLTRVRLFPDVQSANAALKRDKGADSVSVIETPKRPGLLARIASLFAHRPSLAKS